MGTLKTARYEGVVAENAQEAIKLLYETDHHSAILYAPKMETLENMCVEVYEEIKARNQKIPDVEQQMLPTGPYIWDDIDGCLAVKCAEITMGVFSEVAGNLYLFSKPMYSCLTDPEARKPLSSKAIASMALLGEMATGGAERK